MKSSDSYTNLLTTAIGSLEEIYGVLSVKETDIVSVVKGIDNIIMNSDAEDIAVRNAEAGKQIVMVSYVFFRLGYFESVRLFYGLFPAMDRVLEILDLFRDKRKFNKSVRQLNQIIGVLAEVDSTSAKGRWGLGYRYLRIFVILVMYKSSCNASVIANFIIQQVMLKAGE